MDLSAPELAFIEAEMKSIMNDDSRDGEDRMYASAVLGKAEGDIEFEKESHRAPRTHELNSPTAD